MIAATRIFAILAVALVVGVANARPPKKVVGGDKASLGEFPYQVSLRAFKEHICGGTILDERHIITAAHCVVGVPISILRVATGTTTSMGGEIHKVKTIVSHAKYEDVNDGSPYDIAIMTLADEIEFNEYQNKLDLPTAPTPGGVPAVATGWGLSNARSKSASYYLMKIELKTLANDKCQRRYGPDNEIFENQICTYNGRGSGVCQGDSGGPLAYDGQLIGLVSYGIPCAIGYPDVFTSIYHHLSWINKVLKEY